MNLHTPYISSLVSDRSFKRILASKTILSLHAACRRAIIEPIWQDLLSMKKIAILDFHKTGAGFVKKLLVLQMNRKRALRACDFCHLKRIKCVPGEEEEEGCYNCTSRNIACTFMKPVSKRGPIPGTRKSKDKQNEFVDNVPTVFDGLEELERERDAGKNDECDEFRLKIKLYAGWEPNSFPRIKVENGKSSFWLDLYFMYVHSKYPILPVSWTQQNWKLLPLFLHHILYAMTLADPHQSLSLREANLKASRDHFEYCKELYKHVVISPSIMDVLGILFLGIYSLFYTADSVSGISFLHKAMRIGSSLGIYSFADIHWISHDNRICALSSDHGHRFCQLFTFITYELDLHTSSLARAPYSLNTSQSTALFQPFFSDLIYSPFYSSNLWCWRSQVTYIGRRITASLYGLDTPINDSLQLHVRALNSWYESIPKWMLKEHNCYSLDETCIPSEPWAPAPYLVLDMLAYFYTIKLRLLKGWFIETLCMQDTDIAKLPIILDCLDAAHQIDQTCKKLLNANSTFLGISPFFYNCAFASGVFFIMSLSTMKADNIHVANQAIDNSAAALSYYASFCPIASGKLADLQKLRLNPSVSEFSLLVL